MKLNLGRSLAASVGALALIGMGVSSALAADTTNPNWQATPYIADAATAEPVTGTIGFEQQVVGILDLADYNVTYPIPAAATQGWVFVSPRGSESSPLQWNAKSNLVLTPGGILLPNFSLTNQTVAGGGTPNGINAVKAAGGDYSIGVAYTTSNGVNLVPNSLYFGHIHVTAGSGDWTYEPASKPLVASTTTVSVPGTSPQAGAAFDLSATVAPAAASGSVEFFDGATSLGTASLASGSATLNVAAGLSVGTHSITAHYAGDTTYAASTSAAASLEVAGQPVATSLVVSATSASGKASQPATYSATVTPAEATGSVAFSATKPGLATPVQLGTVPVGAGVASLTSNVLGIGDWTVTAAFTGTGLYVASSDDTDAPLALAVDGPPAEDDPQDVVVEIDGGALTITTPHTADHPLDLGTLVLNQTDSTFELENPVPFGSGTPDESANPIKITNSRPDVPTWTAQVRSTDFVSGGDSFPASHVGLINVRAVEVPNNALLYTDVLAQNVTSLSGADQTFASYPNVPTVEPKLGTAWIAADVDINGVPTSTPSGTYRATLTFTAF